MNEDLKRHPELAPYLFTKVYIYVTNTKKPWNQLTEKDFADKKFKWYCNKWFFISSKKLTEDVVKEHINDCPELREKLDDISKKTPNLNKNWKFKSEWYNIYPEVPLRDEGELKLLVNTIGLRMLHFM